MAKALVKFRENRLKRRIRKQVYREVQYELRARGVDTSIGFGKWLDLQLKRGKIPINFSSDSALQLTAVEAAVSIISWGVAELPLNVYEVVAGEEQLVPMDDREVMVVTRRWNNYTSAMDGFQNIIDSAIVHGAGAAWVKRGEFNMVDSIYPLDPTLISRYRVGGDRIVYQYSGEESDVPREPSRADLIFLPFKIPADGVTDVSPFETSWPALRAALCAQEFAADYFHRGATPQVVYSSTGNFIADTYKKAVEAFWAVMDRMRKSNRREMLIPGSYRPHVVGGNPQESDLSAQRTFGAQEVARCVQIPSQVLEPSRGTYSNYTQAERFLAKPLRRWARRLAFEIGNVVWPGGTRTCRFDTDRLVEEPHSVRVSTAREAVDAGIWSINEGREYTGREPKNSDEPEDSIYDALSATTTPQITVQATAGAEDE